MNEDSFRFAHLQGVALTDIGRKRKNNEDAYGAFPDHGVWCVADGMGGGDDGEVASAAVVKSVDAFLSDLPSLSKGAYSGSAIVKGVVSAVEEASGWIYRRTKKNNLKGCGSTFVCIVFDATNPGSATALHVGDSRLYRLRRKEFKQITKDHSVAEMMGAKDESQLNPMFRGMILKAVGIESSIDVEKTQMSIAEGDIILVCSDGLTRMLPDKHICEILKNGRDDIESTAKKLVFEANEAGGIDNVTVELVKVGQLPPPQPVVNVVHGENSSQTSSTVQALDQEYGGNGWRTARRALIGMSIVCGLLVFGWMIAPSLMREKKIVSAAPIIDSMPKVEPQKAKKAVLGADARQDPVVTASNDIAIAQSTMPSATDESSSVAQVTAANVEDERSKVEKELRKERERRRREDDEAARQEQVRKQVARDLAKCYDRSFVEFAMFVNVVLGKGTCDHAQSLCRRLHMRGMDLDASLFATDFAAEVIGIAGRLEAKCRRGNIQPGGVVAVLIEKCRCIVGKDPSLPEVQKGCLELIDYVDELRRPSNVRK